MNKNLYYILFLVLLASSEFTKLLQAKILKYDDIKTFINSDHHLLKSKKLEISRSKVQLDLTERLRHVPDFDITSGYESFSSPILENNNSAYIFAEARFNIYKGGIDGLNSKKNDIRLDLAKLNFQQARKRLRFTAANYFWQAITKSKEIELLESNQKDLKSLERLIQAKVSSGIVPRSELSFLELSKLSMETMTIDTRHQLSNLKHILSFLLAIESQEALTLDKSQSLETDSLSSDQQHQTDNLDSIEIIEKQLEAIKIEKDTIKANLRPRLDMYGSYGQNRYQDREFTSSSDRLEGVFGLRLTIPISPYITNQQKNMVKSLELNQLEANLNEIKVSTNHRKKLILQIIRDKKDQLNRSSTKLAKVNSAITVVRREFQRGIRDSKDLLTLYEEKTLMQITAIRSQGKLRTLMECLAHIEVGECSIDALAKAYQ